MRRRIAGNGGPPDGSLAAVEEGGAGVRCWRVDIRPDCLLVCGIDVSGVWTIACLCMVFAGELSYWALFSWFFSRICKSVNLNTLVLLGKLTSVAIVVFGVVLIVNGLMKI